MYLYFNLNKGVSQVDKRNFKRTFEVGIKLLLLIAPTLIGILIFIYLMKILGK